MVVQDESREQPQIKALRARARAEETAAVTAKREAAFAIVDGQCSGVRAVSMPQRQALLKELREGALPHGPMTPTQTLNSLLARQRAGDSYWSDTDAGLVSSALHGEDPRIRRLAFAVVVSAIDRGTPEGALRSDALMNAMSLDINGPSLSTFEARLPCALLGQCDDLPFVGGTGPMSPESERLMAAYRQAFDKREPYSRILAIR